MRRALLLLAAGLLGCPASDACVPDRYLDRTFFVRPVSDPGPDNATVAHAFSSIQSALDAAGGGRGNATVCVAAGTYYEELTVPAGTHLLADDDRVRLRPPQTRSDALPTDVDRVLLTLAADPEGPILISGLDVRGGGVCVDATGRNTIQIEDSVIADCAVGLRARGGARVTLSRTPVTDHVLRGVDAVAAQVSLTSGSHLLRNGRPGPWHGREALAEASPDTAWSKDLIAGRGALAAVDATIELDDLIVDESAFSDAVITLDGSSLLATRARLGAQRPAATVEGFLAGDAGGLGPIVSLRSAAVVLHDVIARTEALGLVQFDGPGNGFSGTNLSWSGQRAVTSDGTAGAVASGTGDGTVLLDHATLLGPDDAWGIDLDGGPWQVELRNSILWGHTAGRGIRLPAGDAPTLQSVLAGDDTLTGDSLILGQDPLLDDTADGLGIAADSPARCSGLVGALLQDLNGDPRPFTDGKAPDLGAIELQQACP